MALEDAQRTVGLVRFNAAKWHIDPHKIGVLGFSAGGHLAAAISNHFGKRIYRHVDAADEASCRPDFAVPIYPVIYQFLQRGGTRIRAKRNSTLETQPIRLWEDLD